MTKEEPPAPPTIEELDHAGKAPWVQTLTLQPWTDPFTFSDLFQELNSYFRRYLVLTDERQYDVLAAWTLHTWRINDWICSGPLWIEGAINSGKTTVLDALEYVAFKGVRGGSMSNAVMFRMNEDHTPAYLLDESRVLTNPEFSETQAFLNERYKKNGKVWRVEEIGGRRVYKSFNCYGATAFAGDGQPWDAMGSRAIVIHMDKGKPPERTLTKNHQLVGYELRRKLKTFMDHWVNAETVRDDLELYPETVPRYLAKIQDSRVQEVGEPLLVMSPDTGPRERIGSYLVDLDKRHDAEESTGYMADWVLALKNSALDGEMIAAGDIRKQLAVIRGVNPDKPPRGFPGSKGVMSAMKTLGFMPGRTSKDNLAAIHADPARLEGLVKRYKLGQVPISSVSSGSSGLSVSKPEQPEQPEQKREGGLYVQKTDSLGGPLSCEYCGEEWETNEGYRKHVCPVGPGGMDLSKW